MDVGAAPPLRLHGRRPDGVRGRAPHRPHRGGRPPASCSRARSSAPASARCATSSPPSSPSRTRSSGPASAAPSACRAPPAPGRPPSACTGSRTCSTRTATGSPAPARWSSGRTRSFLHYIEQVLPALGELDVKQATVDDLVAHVEVRGTDTAGRPPSRATPGWPRCCARGASGRTSPPPTEPLVVGTRFTPLAGPGVRTRRDRRGVDGTGTSVTAPPARLCRSASRTRSWSGWSRRARPPTTGCRTRWPATRR